MFLRGCSDPEHPDPESEHSDPGSEHSDPDGLNIREETY